MKTPSEQTEHAMLEARNIFVGELTPKQQCADEMYDLLDTIENDDGKIPEWLWDRIQAVKKKARGEA